MRVGVAIGILGAVAACALASVASAQTPPTARPGQCFARVTIPEVAETYTEVKVVAPERIEERAVPATYEMVDMQVLVREPTTEQAVVPGVYRSFVESVMVTPARVEPVVIPATMETYTQRVMVRPAYVTWKPGAGLLGRAATINAVASSTGAGELLCRVEVPAQYAQVRRTRIKTPESISQRTIPAVTRQVTRQELVTPARVEARPLAAVYETRRERRLVTAASTQMVTVPEVRRTEQLRRILEPARVEWREVLCGTNASKARLADIQRALNARGFPTASDGVFGDQTLASMEAFQRANHLAVGYLTLETVSALGVSTN